MPLSPEIVASGTLTSVADLPPTALYTAVYDSLVRVSFFQEKNNPVIQFNYTRAGQACHVQPNLYSGSDGGSDFTNFFTLPFRIDAGTALNIQTTNFNTPAETSIRYCIELLSPIVS